MLDRIRKFLQPRSAPDPETVRVLQRADTVMEKMDRAVAEDHHRSKVLRLQQMHERRDMNVIERVYVGVPSTTTTKGGPHA